MSSTIVIAALAFAAAALASWAGTGQIRRMLLQGGILDQPNARSSHQNPTPRGAGLAVVPVVALGLALTLPWQAATTGTATTAYGVLTVALLALALGALSFADDVRSLSVTLRLGAQAAAIALIVVLFPFQGPVFGGVLPDWADAALTAIAWLWFVNLYNFMDGIDGLAGGETAAIGVGVAAIAIAGALGTETVIMGSVAAGAAAGFLIWNRPPARIFLGDAGSVPLGFLLGWLLLDLAARGAWTAALILPLYYLADATLTLIRRAVAGEAIWQAHRRHFYQQAVLRGASHGEVSRAIAIVNAGLVALATASAGGWLSVPLALALAVLIVALLLVRLARWPQAVAANAPGPADA